jgi:hypothetical protein
MSTDDDIIIRMTTRFKFYGVYVRGWYLLVGLPAIGFVLGKWIF